METYNPNNPGVFNPNNTGGNNPNNTGVYNPNNPGFFDPNTNTQIAAGPSYPQDPPIINPDPPVHNPHQPKDVNFRHWQEDEPKKPHTSFPNPGEDPYIPNPDEDPY